MKLSYYGYSVQSHSENRHYLFDLRPFIRSFAAFDDFDFKNKFQYHDNPLFLVAFGSNHFLFLIARSDEIIKKISSADHSCEEIYDLLTQDEKLGFASYLVIKNSYLGFATSMRGAGTNAFTSFMNQIFKVVGLGNYHLVLHPMLQHATYAEALKMPFLGASALKVSKENSLFGDLKNVFSGSSEEFTDVDSFEVIIRPKRKQNIEKAIKQVVKKVSKDDSGLQKMTIKARDEYGGRLTQLYLIGKGHLSDDIKKASDFDMFNDMAEKINNNEALEEMVKKHESDVAFKKEEPEDFMRFSDPDSWPDIVRSL